MAASEDNFISQIFLNGCFSRSAAKMFIRNSSYTYFTFLTMTSCKRGRSFYGFFLGKGFDGKSKHTELALYFIQKQYFS